MSAFGSGAAVWRVRPFPPLSPVFDIQSPVFIHKLVGFNINRIPFPPQKKRASCKITIVLCQITTNFDFYPVELKVTMGEFMQREGGQLTILAKQQ